MNYEEFKQNWVEKSAEAGIAPNVSHEDEHREVGCSTTFEGRSGDNCSVGYKLRIDFNGKNMICGSLMANGSVGGFASTIEDFEYDKVINTIKTGMYNGTLAQLNSPNEMADFLSNMHSFDDKVIDEKVKEETLQDKLMEKL